MKTGVAVLNGQVRIINTHVILITVTVMKLFFTSSARWFCECGTITVARSTISVINAFLACATEARVRRTFVLFCFTLFASIVVTTAAASLYFTAWQGSILFVFRGWTTFATSSPRPVADLFEYIVVQSLLGIRRRKRT